jgi:putative transposase
MPLQHFPPTSRHDLELILAERGILVTLESIRHWCLKFGADFARRLRLRAAAARRHLAPR